jgi:hypothetical protein
MTTKEAGLLAQGDILLEPIAEIPISGVIINPDKTGAITIAEGEGSGHRHIFQNGVTMFRDDGLARDIETGLYIGHINVTEDAAILEHDEHNPITVPKGSYRVRRQREMDPKDAAIVSD